MSINIYLTNLGKYVEGSLVGQWVKLPVAEDKLDTVLAEIGINEEYEEYFITDFESSFEGMRINEFTNLSLLNELAEKLDELSSDEERKFAAILEYESCDGVRDMEELLDRMDDFDLMEHIEDDEALGYYYAEDCGCIDIPDNLKNYFDYEAYGRDIRLEGNGTFSSYGYLVDNR